MRSNYLISRIFAFATAAALSGCGQSSATAKSDKDAEPAAIPVEVAAVERGDLVVHYAGTAPLEAAHAATVVAEVPGTVLKIDVEEGDRVAAGQVLAHIDADRGRLELRQNETDLQRLKNEVARNETLADRHVISATAFDQSRADFLSRQADTNLARQHVRKSELRAPFAGIVTRRWIKPGHWLEANAKVFDIADFSELQAQLAVPERDASALKVGQPVNMLADAWPGKNFSGKIERIAPVVDRASGTVAVTIAVDNSSGMLRPGLFSRLDIAYEHFADATLLPKSAVLDARDATKASNKSTVFVIEDGKARRVDVELGHESAGRVQVLSGIAPGAMVVTAGQSGLSDGATVNVLKNALTEVAAGDDRHG